MREGSLRSPLRSARSALRLDRRARGEALRALGWLLIVRALLATVPYSAVRRILDRFTRPRRSHTPIDPPALARAVERAARVLPRSRCLARGLTAEYLLRSNGWSAELTLGVAVGEAGQLRAHAWVRSGDLLVTGGDGIERFAPLAPPRGP